MQARATKTGWRVGRGGEREREKERGILCLNVAVIRARMPEWCTRNARTDLETNLSRLRGCDSCSSGRDYRYCDAAFERSKMSKHKSEDYFTKGKK